MLLRLSWTAGDVDIGGVEEQEDQLGWWLFFVKLVECRDCHFIAVVDVAV